MKKGFIAFVKALFGVAKVMLAILGVLVLAVVRYDAGKFSDRIDKINRIMRNGLWSEFCQFCLKNKA